MTTRSRITSNGAKVAKIIKSCYTIRQLEVARCVMYNFFRKYYNSSQLQAIFDNQYKEITIAYSTTIDDGTEHF